MLPFAQLVSFNFLVLIPHGLVPQITASKRTDAPNVVLYKRRKGGATGVAPFR